MAVWVYILRCADDSYYTGLTTDLEQRLAQHHAGTFEGFTSTRLPVECVYVAEFAGAWDSLPMLARSHQHHGRPGERPASFDTAASPPAQDD